MTAIGVVTGAVITGISVITGHGGDISFENNAITFTAGLNLGGSITLGNVIIHAGPGGISDWNSEATVDRYDGNGKVNLGEHEEAHTYQYQALGVFTIPAIIGSAVSNGGLGTDNWHDFMGKSDFERAADDYAQFGSSPMP
jgi:hypothetical protein